MHLTVETMQVGLTDTLGGSCPSDYNNCKLRVLTPLNQLHIKIDIWCVFRHSGPKPRSKELGVKLIKDKLTSMFVFLDYYYTICVGASPFTYKIIGGDNEKSLGSSSFLRFILCQPWLTIPQDTIHLLRYHTSFEVWCGVNIYIDCVQKYFFWFPRMSSPRSSSRRDLKVGRSKESFYLHRNFGWDNSHGPDKF